MSRTSLFLSKVPSALDFHSLSSFLLLAVHLEASNFTAMTKIRSALWISTIHSFAYDLLRKACVYDPS